MTTKAAEKIISGITEALAGFEELKTSIEEDISAGPASGGKKQSAKAIATEIAAAISLEMRSILDTIVEEEEQSVETLAAFSAALTDAIEELDPDVFDSEDEDEDDEVDEDDDDDSDDDDDDDFDDEEDGD